MELWLQGQQLHRMQGGRATEAGRLQGGQGRHLTLCLFSLSPPEPAASSWGPLPAAWSISPNLHRALHATLRKDTYSPDVTPFNFQAPKGEAKQTKAGRGWVAQGHTASKQQNANSNLDLSSGVTVASEREAMRSHCFLFQMKQSGKKSRRPSLSLVSHVTLYSLPTLS